MNQRLNITLPEQTVRMLDRAAPRGQRSRFIDEAVTRFIKEQGERSFENRSRLVRQPDPSVTERWLRNGLSFLTNPHDSTKEGGHLSGQLRSDAGR